MSTTSLLRQRTSKATLFRRPANFAWVLLLLVGAGVGVTVQADDKLDFLRDIRPILSNNCYRCHGPGTQDGDLRLDIRELALKAKAIVPGDSKKSLLLQRIAADDDERMPPKDAADRLKPEQIDKLRRWIEQGADWAPHWAYQPAKKASPPVTSRPDWNRSPIDAYVAARLEKERLAPSAEADRRVLARRVSLDLIGLLPTPDEVVSFVEDQRPDAYERFVDRLLASPHLGERQGRHWLDLARYADSNGYTIDGARTMWPWRDWVVAALNRDVPFDQFTVEQLAGDLLPQASYEQIIATGFHRNTSFNEEGGTDAEQFRVERTVDRTNTTGAVWLGMTVLCAQCHNHKYDEISQREYYQLYAFFNNADEAPPLRMPSAEQTARLGELQAELKRLQEEQKSLAEKAKADAEVKAKVAASEGVASQKTPATESDAAKKLAASLEQTLLKWGIAEPATAKAKSKAALEILPDHSVLAAGKPPQTDVYTIHARVASGTFSAVRLEALTHEKLSARGPGTATGNFVLSHFQVETAAGPIKFTHAVADHSQPGYPAVDALLGNPSQGWAIRNGKGKTNVDRQAVFVAEKPFTVATGETLTFRLTFAENPPGYLLGRMRFGLTDAAPEATRLPIEAQQILAKAVADRSDAEKQRLAELIAAPPTAKVPAVPKGPSDEETKIAARIKSQQDQIKAFERSIKSSLVFRPAAKPRVTNIQLRGDFLAKGDEVQPAVFASLPPLEVTDRVATRLDLAQWLTRPDHPLTPRVTANRMWQQFFGRGLVETENDFGMQGSLPSHPELLDWLALELARDNAWSLKRTQREVVTSATYRQASLARDDARRVDPQNKLLARQNRLRLEAEIIRDAALSASGLLSRMFGGPGVYPPQPTEVFSFTQARKDWKESQGSDRYRRGLYTYQWRQSLHPLLTTFDGAEAQTACTRRNRSNTPLQALHLANDTVFVEMADGLGKRIAADASLPDDAAKLERAFQLCFSRPPTADEQKRMLGFLAAQQQANPDNAWTLTARVLLNLDEFISRE